MQSTAIRVLPLLCAFALAAPADAQQFPGRQLTTGSIAHELLPGDFTGDGVIDVAVVTDLELATLVGDGNGGYDLSAPSPFTGLGVPGFIARAGRAGHLNGDGFLDVLVMGSDFTANWGRFVVMLGQGDGSFAVHTWALHGCDVRTFELADLDHDGDLDAVLPNDCPGEFAVLLNNGAGTFAVAGQYAAGGASALQIADVDGDGELDVAVGRSTAANAISIHLGNAAVFGAGTNYALSNAVLDLAAGDVDGDGDCDLIALINSGANHRLVRLLNDGSGVFTITNGLALGEADQIALGDLDGDGRPDVLAVDQKRCRVARNLGVGQFELTNLYAAGRIFAPPALHDVDADGRLDALFGGDDAVTLLRGLGACAFDGGKLASGPPVVRQGAAGDLDGDGDDEIVLAATSEVRVMRRTGPGEFELATTVAVPMLSMSGGIGAQHVELGDVDGDGELDAVVGNFANTVVWMRGDGQGGLGAPAVVDTSSGVPDEVAASIAVGDVDGDGLEDVVATPWAAQPYIILARSLGNGSFAPPQAHALPVPAAAHQVVLGDLDADGREDAIVHGGSLAVVLLGQATGGFGAASVYALPPGPTRMTLGDVDGDHDLDLVVLASTPGVAFAVLLGDGAGHLGAPIPSGPAGGGALTLVDLDGDGTTDVLALRPDEFAWYHGDGSGSFTLRERFATEYFAGATWGALIARDTNADRALDLIVPTPSFSVYVQHADGATLGSYCTPKTNSLGCVPRIASTGTALASAASGFLVSAAPVINDRIGLCFYGLDGASAAPFAGGTMCVRQPRWRSVTLNSGGSAPPTHDCSGTWSIDMAAFASGALGGNPRVELQVPGTHVFCQWWGRDGGFAPATNVQLSDALHYVVLP